MNSGKVYPPGTSEIQIGAKQYALDVIGADS